MTRTRSERRAKAKARGKQAQKRSADVASPIAGATVSLRPVVVAMLLAFAVTLAVFWPSVENGFILDWDDAVIVVKNPRVTGGLSSEGLVWAFTATHSVTWHPVTSLSHMLDVEFFGLEPSAHHRTSVVLHALNASLLLLGLSFAFMGSARASGRLRVDDSWKIALVVAIFALHPLRVESVTWVSERKDVLSGAFFFIMLAGYCAHARRPSRGLFYPAVLLPLALGLMSKPMLVSAPFLLLLFDFWPLRRVGSLAGPAKDEQLSLRALAIEKIPLLVIVVASMIVTFAVQVDAGVVSSLGHTSIGARIPNAFVAYSTYLEQLVWPAGLAAFYPQIGDVYPASDIWRMALVPMLLFAIANAAALALRRRAPYLVVGLGWYLIAILPVIGLVQVGAQGWADRYTYLSLIGPTWALVWGADALARRFCERVGARPAWATSGVLAAGAAVCIAFVSLTRAQIATWKDRDSVWTHALEVVPRNYRAAMQLGALRYEQGRYTEAVEVLERADAIVPNWAPIQQMLGIAYRAAGEFDKADKAVDRENKPLFNVR